MHNVNISKISRLRINSECDGVSTLIGCMGCPLRCAYCFNPFTWDGSVEPKKYSIDELYEEVKLDNLYFLATEGDLVFGGGEPLLYSTFIKEFIKIYENWLEPSRNKVHSRKIFVTSSGKILQILEKKWE